MDIEAIRKRARLDYRKVPKKVLAFYYPWYGLASGPGGAGRTVHWGRIDAAKKDIQASTHYPELGAYDSHDPKLIDQHCRWAKQAGIDGWIVSWWGHGDYTDRPMGTILDACRRHGLVACLYYETVPNPQTPQAAADDILRALKRYGKHPAHLTAEGRPVVFIYVRAMNELGLPGWLEAIKRINDRYDGAAALIADQLSSGAARIFDGVHTYNTCGAIGSRQPKAVREWAAGAYADWVRMAGRPRRISTLTVIPGYDDTKIRTPGLCVKRYDGAMYRAQWERAIEADPHWVLITSFNEWHEGSEVEPSAEDGRQYLKLTAEYAKRFKAKPRAAHDAADAVPRIPPAELERLRKKLAGVRVAALPGGSSMGLWWLAMELCAPVDQLTWGDVAGGRLSAKSHPLLLYAGNEHYRSTVTKAGDVDAAISRYLKEGGWLVALPSLPWPFYYDENDQAVRRSGQFGLTLHRGWEQPPAGRKLTLVQPQRKLPHLPRRFAFPKVGDMRWRPFVAGDAGEYVALLELRDEAGKHLGDGAAYRERPGGGGVLYVWFALLETPRADGLLYDVFALLADRVGAEKRNP